MLHAQFDHLVVAIRALREGIAEFERLTGVSASIGGRHPGRGTENALVSLGPGEYLEIIAPQQGAAISPQDQPMLKLDRLRITAWAVAVNDVDAAVAALGGAGFAATAPQHGSRVTPAGERLEWTVFRLAGEPIAAAPFFIRWSEGTKHPSTASPGGCSLANLTIGDPGAARLAAALDALGVQGVRTKAAPTKLEAQLTCGPGNVTLASV